MIIIILQIRVGRNITFPPNGTTGPEWTLVYINNTSFGLEFIIGVVTGSAVAIILIVILLLVIIFLARRTNLLKKT